DGDHLPVVQLYNLLRSLRYGPEWVYGMQVTSAGQLPADHWIAQINKCRAEIQGANGSEPTYRSGGEIAVGTKLSVAVRALLDACNGRLSEAGGIYKPFVGAPDEPVATFTDQDILSTEEQRFTPFFGLADTVNGVSAKFPDPEQAWQVETAPPLNRPDFEVQDGRRRLMVDVELDLVPYPELVQRLMRSALNEARRARRHTFTLPPRFWTLEPGDIISWTSARNGYISKLFRVDGVLDQPNANVVVDLTEVDPTDYDFDTGVDYTPSQRGSVIPFNVPAQQITGWSVSPATVPDGNGEGVLPAILVQWSGTLSDVVAVRVQVRVAASGVLVFDGRVEDVASGQGLISQSLVRRTDYLVRGKYVPGTPRETEWSDDLPVQTPDVGVGSSDFFRRQLDDYIALYGLSNDVIDRALEERAAIDLGAIAARLVDQATAAGEVDEVRTDLSQDIGDANTSITQLEQVAISNTASLSLLETDLEAGFDGVNARLEQDYLTAADTQTALAQMETTLVAEIGANAAQVTILANSFATLDQSFADFEVQVNAEIDGVIAYANQTFYSRAQTDSAIASSITTVETELNGLTTTVEDIATAQDGILGQRTFRVNANGAIVAMTLMAGGGSTDVIFHTENFRVGVSTAGNGFIAPFQVVSGQVVMRNVVIGRAVIEEAAIGTLELEQGSVHATFGSTRTTTLTGDDDWQVVHGGFLFVEGLAFLSVDFTGQHNYINVNLADGYGHELRLVIEGDIVATQGGLAVEDNPSLQYTAPLVADGFVLVSLQWKAGPALRMNNRTLRLDASLR
ncbi:MAG: phage tail protein, partial [Pseudomonadota bacterium]